MRAVHVLVGEDHHVRVGELVHHLEGVRHAQLQAEDAEQLLRLLVLGHVGGGHVAHVEELATDGVHAVVPPPHDGDAAHGRVLGGVSFGDDADGAPGVQLQRRLVLSKVGVAGGGLGGLARLRGAPLARLLEGTRHEGRGGDGGLALVAHPPRPPPLLDGRVEGVLLLARVAGVVHEQHGHHDGLLGHKRGSHVHLRRDLVSLALGRLVHHVRHLLEEEGRVLPLVARRRVDEGVGEAGSEVVGAPLSSRGDANLQVQTRVHLHRVHRKGRHPSQRLAKVLGGGELDRLAIVMDAYVGGGAKGRVHRQAPKEVGHVRWRSRGLRPAAERSTASTRCVSRWCLPCSLPPSGESPPPSGTAT